MAFIYRPKNRPRYFARFKDPATGRWLTKAAYTDKAASKQLACRLEREAARAFEGIGPSKHSLAPLAEHVEAFTAHLAAKGDTPDHVEQRRRHLETVAEACGWKTLPQLEGTALELWLARRRAADLVARGPGRQRGPRFSARTSNHYLASLKHFARWAVRFGRLQADPFRPVAPVNADVDRRHERRALTPGEFAALVAAARAGKSYLRLTGQARAVLYLVAAYTGLRASELSSLRPSSFDFKSDPPTWAIAARAEKARRGDRLPIHPELLDELRRYCAGVSPLVPLWPGKWAAINAGAKMLRHDLAAAGIPYRTADGMADFHSLRVTFVTMLFRGGVSLHVAQRLARHSTPNLTSNVYGRLDQGDLAAELGKVTMRETTPHTLRIVS